MIQTQLRGSSAANKAKMLRVTSTLTSFSIGSRAERDYIIVIIIVII